MSPYTTQLSKSASIGFYRIPLVIVHLLCSFVVASAASTDFSRWSDLTASGGPAAGKFCGSRACTPLVVYMATDGASEDDASGELGLSREKPVGTLDLAQAVIRDQLESEHRDVEVLIAPGTYRDQRVEWSYTMRGNTITFRPRDEGTRPVFDGKGLEGDEKNKEWFKLAHAGGEKTNIVIEGLQIQFYGRAINLYSGNRWEPLASNSHNVIRNNIIKDVGDSTTSAIGMQNSKFNLVEGNHFRRIRSKDQCGQLHVIYIAHYSSNNTVRGNVFEDTCSGSAVRVRDASNGNLIEDNTFIRASTKAYFEDWYCDPERGEKVCTKRRPDPDSSNSDDEVFAPECPSKGNVFSHNRLAGSYSGSGIKAHLANSYSVAEECEAVSNKDRILPSNNKPEPQSGSLLAPSGLLLIPSGLLQVATAWVFPSASGAFTDHVATRLNGEFPDAAHWVAGDFDGDKFDDVAVIRNEAGKSAVRIFPSEGNGISLSALFDEVLEGNYSTKHRWRAGDFDGDGRDDLVQIYDHKGEASLFTYLSSGDSFLKPVLMRTGANFSDSHHWEVGNFNGDDFDDLVLVYSRQGNASSFTFSYTGSTFVQTSFQRMGANFSETDLWRVGDFDADGLDDLVLLYNYKGKTSAFTYSSNGDSFDKMGFQRMGASFSESNRWQVGDFDNDGLDDLVLVYKGKGKASTFTFSSTGSSSTVPTFEQTNFKRLGAGFWDDQIWVTGNFSGDSADDLVLVYGFN